MVSKAHDKGCQQTTTSSAFQHCECSVVGPVASGLYIALDESLDCLFQRPPTANPDNSHVVSTCGTRPTVSRRTTAATWRSIASMEQTRQNAVSWYNPRRLCVCVCVSCSTAQLAGDRNTGSLFYLTNILGHFPQLLHRARDQPLRWLRFVR